MTDRERICEFLDTIASHLDELYGADMTARWQIQDVHVQRLPGPTIEDLLDDPREWPSADNHPGIQYALGWLRGAAEILDLTVLELLWDHDLGDDDITAWPRRAPFAKPKPRRRARAGRA